jgi:ribosomal protein L40E
VLADTPETSHPPGGDGLAAANAAPPVRGVKETCAAAEDACVTDVRCPSCSAHVAPAAAWCGQCYTSLAREPVKPPRAALHSGMALQVVAEGSGSVALLGELPPPPPGPPGSVPPPPPAPPGDAPGKLAVGKPPWPCMRCETVNPYAANVCTACGHGFLDSLSEESTRLPLIGDVTDISRSTKVKIGLAVSLGLCLVILVVFTVAGLVFG